GEMIYEDNGSGETGLTKSRNNLDNVCIAWLRKVEALRNCISKIKQTEGLLEKKDNKIKECMNINLNGIEKDRYEALEESKSTMSLGDEVNQEELMNDNEKRINEGNEKNGIVSSIKDEEYQMNVIEFENLPELDDKEVLIKSANEMSN
ncbi:1781_t:CDS:1, partial [Gigaspora rosea]